jgi:DNA-binding LacI/PurR family transcriptional regulator
MRSTISERVHKYRAALRAAGLRPVQIWVPDTRRAGFAEECRRQSLALHGDVHEQDMLDWLSEVADIETWEPSQVEKK